VKNVMEYVAPIATAALIHNVKAFSNVSVLNGKISPPVAEPQSAGELPIEPDTGRGLAGSSQR